MLYMLDFRILSLDLFRGVPVAMSPNRAAELPWPNLYKKKDPSLEEDPGPQGQGSNPREAGSVGMSSCKEVR